MPICITNLYNFFILKISSTNPIKKSGKSIAKLFWPKINEEKKFEIIKASPPARGLVNECELLLFGISGINLLKGLIINLVKYQLSKELIKKIINISKIISIIYTNIKQN